MTTQTLYSNLSGKTNQPDVELWSCFSNPESESQLFESWLSILCGRVHNAQAALLLTQNADNTFGVAAVWPDTQRDIKYLQEVAEKALREKRGVVSHLQRDRRTDIRPVGIERRRESQRETLPRSSFVGYPISIDGELKGAVIVDLSQPDAAQLQTALRDLHWASAWLSEHFLKNELKNAHQQSERVAIASEIAATALKHKRLGAASLAIANELAHRMRCDQVSIGFEEKGSIRVQAISNTAQFDKKSDAVRLIGEAMDEVLDLDSALEYPPSAEGLPLGSVAHAALAAANNSSGICSVPLDEFGHAEGVILFERRDGTCFDPQELALCKATGLLLGPILALLRKQDRNAFQKTRDAVRSGASLVFGNRFPGIKLLASIVALVVMFSFVYHTDYRISSRALVEGTVQRAASAAFQGYLAQTYVRAGDVVEEGAPLFKLDDRDLKIDTIRWESEREQAEKRFRQALAENNRTAMTIAQAQVAQANAQLELATERLQRATAYAPFSGVIVSGDHKQRHGSPVEQGEVLFEIAPLDAYRVILQVDERDIADLNVGQQGHLALSGMPYDVLPFSVKQITPISTAEGGKNFFRVEAELETNIDRLRPGMEGVGKVGVGERSLIWIYTHRLVDWFRLWMWEWTP